MKVYEYGLYDLIDIGYNCNAVITDIDSLGDVHYLVIQPSPETGKYSSYGITHFSYKFGPAPFDRQVRPEYERKPNLPRQEKPLKELLILLAPIPILVGVIDLLALGISKLIGKN